MSGVIASGEDYTHDNCGRLAGLAITPSSGPAIAMNFQYDRYGNRTAQNVTQGSGAYPQPQLSFNSANNQVATYCYDVAGNVIWDGVNSYTYDAENNLIAVGNMNCARTTGSSASIASYQFDAMNERVVETTSAGTFHYSFDLSGRSTQWDSTGALLQAQYYGSAGRLAYWSSTDSNIHFEHADWEGTERERTLPTAAVDGYYSSLPFGDGASSSGSDTNAGHFATLDQDVSSSSLGLSHATFREYHSTSGRWMSPDWYSGSYTAANPQSMNRYAYTLNTPSFFTDPSGLCVTNYTDTEGYSGVGGTSSTTTSSEDDGSSACTSWQDFVGPGGGGYGGGGGGEGGSAPSNPHCAAGPGPSHMTYGSASATVAMMATDFFSGTGPNIRDFGPQSAVSQVMAQSAQVQDVLYSYNLFGQTSGDHGFGWEVYTQRVTTALLNSSVASTGRLQAQAGVST